MPDDRAIETRLTLIEHDLAALTNTKRWIQGVAFVVLLQIGAALYAFAQLQQQVGGLEVGTMQTNIATALAVLADHGDELEGVRELISRNISKLDQHDQNFIEVGRKIDMRTHDRFFRADGEKLEDRITRLENMVFKTR